MRRDPLDIAFCEAEKKSELLYFHIVQLYTCKLCRIDIKLKLNKIIKLYKDLYNINLLSISIMFIILSILCSYQIKIAVKLILIKLDSIHG